MTATNVVLDKAKVLVLFAFCLLNPFAGWAYLAQARREESLRLPAFADTVKPRRLAILPMAVASPAGLDADWAGAFEIDFADVDELEVVPLAETRASRDPERNVLALARSVHADLVLDASAFVDEGEGVLRLFARLIRTADATVRWSELFVEDIDRLPRIREEIETALLRTL